MDEVRKTSAQVDAMAEPWPMLDALMGGTGAMRKAGKRFLPQWPKEPDASYSSRLTTATLFPAYERTVSILVGKPFSKPVTLGEDVPPRIAALMDNVDLEGRTLHAFAAGVASNALSHGFCGILVDCPPNPFVLQEGRAPSVQEEREAGLRPYFVHIRHDQVLGWRSERQGGLERLTQLRLLENVEVEDGPFATKNVEQVRVLEPGRWSIWRKMQQPGRPETWAMVEEGATTLDFVPFVPVYGRRLALMVGVPPMLELAFANVEHWQAKSDRQTLVHVASVPILFARGLEDQEIAIGANCYVRTGSETAELKYVEHSGAAIEAGRMALLDLEDRMRQAGAELLVIKPGDATTVQVMAENEQAKCDLQRLVQELEAGLDVALDYMAAWIGEKDGGHVQIFSDFGAATLTEASAAMLGNMHERRQISHATMLSEMQRRGIISTDVDVPAEIAAVTAEAAARPRNPEGNPK